MALNSQMVKTWVEACVDGMLIAYCLPAPLVLQTIPQSSISGAFGQVEEMNEGKTTYLDLTAFSFHIMKKVTASL